MRSNVRVGNCGFCEMWARRDFPTLIVAALRPPSP
jgi:hypothetical protein